MKIKCSEFQLNKFILIPTTGNGVPPNLRGGPWKNSGQYIKLLYNYHELSEYQVTELACYNWGGSDVHCVKVYLLVTLPLDFTVADPWIQRAKEKQQYRICAEMIFQIIKNNVPKKDFELYMVELDRFLFTDISTGNKIWDSVIMLKIILDGIKPSTVIDMQDLEEKFAPATLQKYENNVLSCTR